MRRVGLMHLGSTHKQPGWTLPGMSLRYLPGTAAFARRDTAAAAVWFTRATTIDPGYEMAWRTRVTRSFRLGMQTPHGQSSSKLL